MHKPYELYGQFILQPTINAASVPDWPSETLHGWTFSRDSALPLLHLRTSTQSSIGWLLGWPIVRDALITDHLTLEPDILANFEAFESWLTQLAGRFLTIVFDPLGSKARIYPDAGASLSLVYSTNRKLVASTPTALHIAIGDIEDYRQRKSVMQPMGANQFYPAGLTSDDDIRRLFPNHYLDLDRWEILRYQPRASIERVSSPDAEELASGIATRARCTVEAIAQNHSISMGLTAGRDSRMLLAGGRNILNRIEFFTFNYKNPQKFADVHIASLLARRFRLNHRVIDLRDPTREMKSEFLYRIGYTNNPGRTCDFYDACYRQLDMRRAFLTGFSGEVGRAYYWKPDDPGKMASFISSEELLIRMNLSTDIRNIEAMNHWRASLPPDIDACMMLDLMYQELRLGCWASPQIYGSAPFSLHILPLCHHENFKAMLSMPLQYRIDQQMTNDVVRSIWPELLSVPFQSLTGWRALSRRLHQKWQRLVSMI